MVERQNNLDPWQEKQEAKRIVEEKNLLDQRILEINKILPWASFYREWKYWGFYLIYKNEKLDMNFANYESLKNAVSIISRTKRIYDTEFWWKNNKPKFYLNWNKISIKDGIFFDTTYLSSSLTENFLSKSQINDGSWKFEIDKLVKFLNITVVGEVEAKKESKFDNFDDSWIKGREFFQSQKTKDLTKSILEIYDKKHKGNYFYVTESRITKWDKEINNNSEMVIKIDNRIWNFDTTILSDNWFQKVFWVNSWRKNNEEMKLYTKYLNDLVDKLINKKR